jgi:predicted acyl esterase
LDISSSNFAHFDCNPNTGEPEGRATHQRIAPNRVDMDSSRPSQVLLPIINTDLRT